MASILDTLDRPPNGKRRPSPRLHPLERITRSYEEDPETGCHVWTGPISNRGYGKLSVTQAGYKAENFSAHKASYELTRGRVPSGLVLDHLCRNRICVNPDHLEVVTQRENTLRSPVAPAALNSAKTHCPQGHEYTPENTYVWTSKTTHKYTSRACRQCLQAYRRRYQAAKRARRLAEVAS